MSAGGARARDFGVRFGGAPGTWNCLTDVPVVEVGYETLISGEGALKPGIGPVRTGVTAILPLGRERVGTSVPAGFSSFNGNGELTGSHWLEESGTLALPVAITNTHAVGPVHRGVLEWSLERNPALRPSWHLPVVAETWDGYLNDINGRHVREETARTAAGAVLGRDLPCEVFRQGAVYGDASRLGPNDEYWDAVAVARHRDATGGAVGTPDNADWHRQRRRRGPPGSARSMTATRRGSRPQTSGSFHSSYAARCKRRAVSAPHPVAFHPAGSTVRGIRHGPGAQAGSVNFKMPRHQQLVRSQDSWNSWAPHGLQGRYVGRLPPEAWVPPRPRTAQCFVHDYRIDDERTGGSATRRAYGCQGRCAGGAAWRGHRAGDDRRWLAGSRCDMHLVKLQLRRLQHLHHLHPAHLEHAERQLGQLVLRREPTR